MFTHFGKRRADALDVARTQQIEHVLAHCLDVPRTRGGQLVHPLLRELGMQSTLVVVTHDASHPPGPDQPVDRPGTSTAGSHHHVRELTHPQPPPGRLGERDQEFEVREGNVGILLQLPIQRTLKQASRIEIGAPGRVLGLAEPSR